MMKVGSLYAGVGGICKAFSNEGFELSWANEYDSKACQTYRENFEHRLYEGDVWDLDIEKMEKVDVLTGGFPCQPFSKSGNQLGVSETRGTLFYNIL